ncbi:urease subunit beta [Streptomyces platensis]|uniref:urease subunit beta n=1 Tax=Streptomyces platensis TaxID=58346 RepID=UPI0030E5B5F2
MDYSTEPGDEFVRFNEGREVTRLRVTNPSDRPVQVGSHYHFAEANSALEFACHPAEAGADPESGRKAAWGKRLHVPADSSVRFEPHMPEDVELVSIEGRRLVHGLRGKIDGLPEKIDGSLDNPGVGGGLDD